MVGGDECVLCKRDFGDGGKVDKKLDFIKKKLWSLGGGLG